MINRYENSFQSFELNSKLKRYKSLVQKTKKFIANSLRQVEKPYLACSFGKDSSVMLHLVLQYDSAISVRFATHPETNFLDSYADVVPWWTDNYKINLQDIYCEGGLLKVKHDQRNKLNEGDWDSFFVGIRAEESFGRKISLRKHGQFHRLKAGRIKICPMAWWKEIDIGTYLYRNNIPVLDKYKHYGIGARTTSGIARTHIAENLQSVRDMDSARFNQLCELYPDARFYV